MVVTARGDEPHLQGVSGRKLEELFFAYAKKASAMYKKVSVCVRGVGLYFVDSLIRHGPRVQFGALAFVTRGRSLSLLSPACDCTNN